MQACKHAGRNKREFLRKEVVWSVGHMMKGKAMSMEVKKALQYSIIVLSLAYASRIWNEI